MPQHTGPALTFTRSLRPSESGSNASFSGGNGGVGSAEIPMSQLRVADAPGQLPPIMGQAARLPTRRYSLVSMQIQHGLAGIDSEEEDPNTQSSPEILLPHCVPRSTIRSSMDGGTPGRCLGPRNTVSLVAVPHEGNDALVGGGAEIPASMDISSLPEELRRSLAVFDTDRNGELDVGEMLKAAELYRSVQQAQTSYKLSTFPERLQKELAALDDDGDGEVSADEFGRAIDMYVRARKQLRWAVKLSIVLALVAMVVLAANMGLGWAVVKLTQETTVGADGQMTAVGYEGNLVSTGKVSEVFEVVADRSTYAALRGGARNSTRNHFAIKPEAIGVSLSDERAYTFPVDFMVLSANRAELGSTQLGLRLILALDESPIFTFADVSSFGAPGSAAAEAPAARVELLRIFTSSNLKRSLSATGDDVSGQEQRERALSDGEPGSEEEELGSTQHASAVEATNARKEMEAELRQVVVEDLSPQVRRNPLASLQRGRPTSWMVMLHSGSPPQAAFDQFCDLVASHGGRCTCVDEADAHAELLAVLAAQNGENVERDGGSCAVEVAVQFNSFELDIAEEGLTALLARLEAPGAPKGSDPDLPEQDALMQQLGIKQVNKLYSTSSPSVQRVPAHHADPHQHARRRQLRELVMSTHKGRHMREALRQQLSADPIVRAAGRGLLEADGAGDEGSGDDTLSAVMSSLGPNIDKECHARNRTYIGPVATSRRRDCLEWTDEEMAQYGLRVRVGCRKIRPDGVPVCPISFGGSRQLSPCPVPHCASRVFASYRVGQPSLGQEQPNWGLARIFNSRGLNYSVVDDEHALTGAGVHCYVLDSGINLDHNEFRDSDWVEDSFKWDAINNRRGQIDETGHGTHVAGIIAGRTTGVAPGCTLHAIKVLGSKSSSDEYAFRGIRMALAHWRAQNLRWRRAGRAAGQPKPRGVVNLSLKSVESASWEVAVNTMVSDGLVVVAAAGNDDQDACRYSPAAQARAITVGASNVDDTKAVYSNWGACVQIYAPGTGIRSARHDNNTDYLYNSGTSLAAPFVTGAAALFLEAHKDASPRDVQKFIYQAASTGLITGVDKKLAGYEEMGLTSEAWQAYLRDATKAGLHPEDDSETINPGNLLLFVGDEVLALDGPALPRCDDDPAMREAQWGPWDLDPDQHCPPPGPICGSKTVEYDGKVYNSPAFPRHRACAATTCTCSQPEEVEMLECDPDGDMYTVVEACGVPASEVDSPEHCTWLAGKRLSFSPQDLTGRYYTVCQSDLDDPDKLPFVTGVHHSQLDKMKRGVHAHIKLNIPGANGFKFLDKAAGEMRFFRTVRIFSNGHIIFHDRDVDSVSGAFNMTSHFMTEGISGLLHGMDFFECNFPSRDAPFCGDLRATRTTTDGKSVYVISFLDVMSKHAPFNLPEFRSTFQIVLYEDTGDFELIFKKVSTMAQRAAVYGVSHGSGYQPHLVMPVQKATHCPPRHELEPLFRRRQRRH